MSPAQRRRHRIETLAFILAKTDSCCGYCGSSLDADDVSSWQIDHVVPLSRGGSDSTENLVAACRSCNLRKGSKTVEEFRKSEHLRLLGLIRDAGEEIVNSALLGKHADQIVERLIEADDYLAATKITFHMD